MDGLSATIQRCNLPLKFDNKTEGFGNCFPNAIVQQCRRPEVKTWLQKNKQWAIVSNHFTLRRKVTNLARSNHKTIDNHKTEYEEATRESWNDYWKQMEQEGTWVDAQFVRVTAWFMGLDILILTTSSKQENPFIHIKGNINNPEASSHGPPLLLGNYTNCHYQSLLPLNQNLNAQQTQLSKLVINTKGIKENENKNNPDDFIYMNNGEQVTFHNLESGKFQCPFCGESFLQIGRHVTSKKCNIHKTNIDTTEFTCQFNSFKDGFRLELKRKRNQKSRVKLKEEKGSKVVKEEQNKYKVKSRDKIRAEKGPEEVKKSNIEQKLKSQAKLTKEKGSEAIKEEQNRRKVKSRDKIRVEKGPEEVKKTDNERKLRSRKRKIEDDPGTLKLQERNRKKLSLQKKRK